MLKVTLFFMSVQLVAVLESGQVSAVMTLFDHRQWPGEGAGGERGEVRFLPLKIPQELVDFKVKREARKA